MDVRLDQYITPNIDEVLRGQMTAYGKSANGSIQYACKWCNTRLPHLADNPFGYLGTV